MSGLRSLSGAKELSFELGCSRIGQYWTGAFSPKLNAGRDRMDPRSYSNWFIEFISPIVITEFDHLCRFSIFIPLSSIIGPLLSFSPIRVHSSLISARSSFPHQRATCDDLPSPAQSRPTTLSNRAARSSQRSQRCLFTRPPLPPLFLFFASIFTSALPASARSRISVPVASKFEQNYLLCICLVQRPMIVQPGLTLRQFRVRHWCHWPLWAFFCS